MISPARQACFQILRQIELDQIFSDEALHSETMQRLDFRDRNLVTEIVYGSLRWQATLDYILDRAAQRSWNQTSTEMKVLLRMSLYQLWRMDRIPDYALVNDAVEIAKRQIGRGASRYVNAILRNLARERPWNEPTFLGHAPLWVQTSLPEWLWKRWAGRFGIERAKGYALSLNLPPPATVRIDDEFEGPLPDAMRPSDLVPGAFFVVQTGMKNDSSLVPVFQYQDEASQLIPHLLGPTPQWKIWDACAAPGGKYSILVRKCGVGGQVIAGDVRWDRIQLLRKSLSNEQRKKANVIVADARCTPPFRTLFDAVLADVPCSGLGTLRRNPEIKWRFRPERLASLQDTQKRILASVSQVVRIGGYLLYSTCSTEPEENEQVINCFLQAHPFFKLELPRHPGGIKPWIGSDGMVRTFPSERLWDGFFAALLKRQR